MPLSFRLLTTQDTLAFQALRLQSLKINSSAFLSDFDSEQQKPAARFSQEIVFASLKSPYGYYGCFVDQELVGYVQINNNGLAKQAHVAFLYNLFFNPAFRGQGLATQLVNNLINLLKQQQIEKLFASCLGRNQTALHFYQQLGFSEYGRCRDSVKWQGQYDDEIELVMNLLPVV